MKTKKITLLMDAMFTLIVPIENDRYALYHTLILDMFGRDIPAEIIEPAYNTRRKEAEAEEKTDQKVEPGYYRGCWAKINALVLQDVYGDSTDWETLLKQGEMIFHEVMYEAKHYRLADGAIDFLEEARSKYLLGLVTNHEEAAIQGLLRHFEIDGFFNRVIVSDKVGYKKPNWRVFHQAVEEFREITSDQLSIDDVAMIGNNPRNDMKGAMDAGILQRFLFDPNNIYVNVQGNVAYQRITRLDEVFKYL